MNIKFKGHDSGNARVYGTHNRKLYCIMEGYNNHGYMGLFACSMDGEPSNQISNVAYIFDSIGKSIIEKIIIRGPQGWGDEQLMTLLERNLGQWEC